MNLGQWKIARRHAKPPLNRTPTGRDEVSTPFSRDPYALRLSFLARSCKKTPFFEGIYRVSISLYGLDRNAAEKSASCELHRVCEPSRPHPPFPAHFEHIVLEIVGLYQLFQCKSALIFTFTASLSFKVLRTHVLSCWHPRWDPSVPACHRKAWPPSFPPSSDVGEGH